MTLAPDDRPLHAVPIPDRPPPTFRGRLRILSFNTTFLLYLVFAHSFQLSFVPFLILSILCSFTSAEPVRTVKRVSREVFRLGIKWTKEIFASILIGLVRFFGTSKLVFTADSREELDRLVLRDEKGRVTGFRIDKYAVWMSNHQCYVDWIMIWLVLAFGNVSEGIVIIIKASLRWAPLVGPAMQMFRFIFISRQKPLSQSTMYETARDSIERQDPFQLVIYPEGTLYSRLTRPKSKAFAQARNIKDMEYTLLPRSTGLLYTLRLLSTLFPTSSVRDSDTEKSSSNEPELKLYDLTLGYSGVEPSTYAQSHYTLQTIFGLGIAPPTVHMHISTLAISSIPIGDVRASARQNHIETEITKEERDTFECWLFERWQEKDDRMGRFKADGRGFVEEEIKAGGRVEFEIELRAEDWVRLTSVPIGLTLFWYAIAYVGRALL
ncbi:uncharacterized protein JCM15063_002857 [Sporobolomyces koalae]|uniref:uncharacterized protein n=1 Tax=Sporobolomyces koalae TaxID=500713 RepID=UPI0031763AE9